MAAYQGQLPPFGINAELAMESFHVDNFAAKQALQEAKARHARRWSVAFGSSWLKPLGSRFLG